MTTCAVNISIIYSTEDMNFFTAKVPFSTEVWDKKLAELTIKYSSIFSS